MKIGIPGIPDPYTRSDDDRIYYHDQCIINHCSVIDPYMIDINILYSIHCNIGSINTPKVYFN